MRRATLLSVIQVASLFCVTGCSLLHPKPLPPTTVAFHDGKRTTTIVIPHDPRPSPVLGFVEAIAGPILTLVGL